MNHNPDASKIEDGENEKGGAESSEPYYVEYWGPDEKPLLYFQNLGRTYKRKTPWPRPRPRDRALEKGEFGPPEELQNIFDSRRQYREEHHPQETIGEVTRDTRDLVLVLKDFPGVHDFVLEVEVYRRQAVERLELIKELRRELVKVGGKKVALQTQLAIDRAVEEETGLVTVAMFVREFGYGSRAGVTKHLRALKDEGLIQDSGAREYGPEETRIIRARLSKSARLKRNTGGN